MSRTILIKRVKLKNILSHDRSEIEFPLGLTAIVGPNGAGKSTIIDSIVYALFARGPRASVRGKSKKDMIRRGANEGEIEVEIEIGGNRYLVRRIISTVRSEDAQLFLVDSQGKYKLLATGVDNVVDHILKLFGVPSPEAIRYTIISRQDELSKLLDVTPSERKDLVLKLLGLHELEKAREILKPYIKKLYQDVAKLETLRIEIDRRKKKISSLDVEVDKLRKELNRLNEVKKEIESTLAKLREVKDLVFEYERLRDVISKIEELKAIDREIMEIREALKLSPGVMAIDIAEAQHILKEVSEVKRSIESLRKQLSQVDSDVERLLEKLVSVGIEKPDSYDLKDIISYLRSLRDELRNRISSLEAEIKIYANSINVIKDKDRCPLCGRPLDEEHKQRLEIEIETKRRSLSEELEKLRSKVKVLEEILEKLEALDRVRLDIVSKIDLHRQRLEELIPKAKPLIAQANELCEELSKIEAFTQCFDRSKGCLEALRCSQQLIEKLKGRLEVLEKKRSELQTQLIEIDTESTVKRFEILRAKIRGLDVDPDTVSYKEIESKFLELNSRLSEVEKSISSIAQRINDYLQQKYEIEKEVKELETEIENLNRSIRVLRVVEYLAERLLGKDGELAKRLTSMARDLIERYSNAVLRSLGLGLQLSVTPDFDIVVKTPLGELSVKNVSGGEKTAIATALRMAMAYAVLGRMPGFFILDEPTAHLDSERRRILFDLIKKISEKLPQVIVVTHDVEVIDIADHVLEVFKEGTRSMVRYISRLS